MATEEEISRCPKKKRKLKADSVTDFYWLMRYMYIQHKDALQELENNTGH